MRFWDNKGCFLMGEITLTLSEALTRAVTLHQSGDLAQAEQIYRKIIGAKPNHFEALHWLGVLRHQCGHHEEADRLVKQAIALNPHYAEAYSSRGAMLGQLKRRDEALQLRQGDRTEARLRGRALQPRKCAAEPEAPR